MRLTDLFLLCRSLVYVGLVRIFPLKGLAEVCLRHGRLPQHLRGVGQFGARYRNVSGVERSRYNPTFYTSLQTTRGVIAVGCVRARPALPEKKVAGQVEICDVCMYTRARTILARSESLVSLVCFAHTLDSGAFCVYENRIQISRSVL